MYDLPALLLNIKLNNRNYIKMSNTTQIPPYPIVYSEPEVRRSIKDGVNHGLRFGKLYHELTKPEPKDKYIYMPYANTSIGGPPPLVATKKEYRDEDAALLSIMGQLFSFSPFSMQRGVGLAMQIPDALGDMANVIETPNDWRNWAHLGLDGLKAYVTKTKTPFDDVLQVGGFVDDAAASQGIDLLEDVEPVFDLPTVTVYGNKKK